jgi:glycosyltransferase involved in cell wall biosynthesis
MADNGAMQSSVSVVMASYNCPKYIEAAVRSAFAQTMPPYEVLLVDDGSQEATLAILQRLAEEFSNLRVVQQRHGGQCVALNRAIGLCRTPLMVGLDHDDLLDPRTCEMLAHAAERRPDAALIYSDYVMIRPDDTVIREVRNPEPHDPVGQLLAMHDRLGGDTRYDFLPFGQACMFRTECLRSLGGYHADIVCSNDVDICLRLGEKWPFAHVPEFLYRYRWHGRNMGATRRAEQIACFREVVRRYRWRKENGIAYGPPNLGEMEMLVMPDGASQR